MCRSAKYFDHKIKNVNKTRRISQNSHIFTYKSITFDEIFYVSCSNSLCLVNFILKFMKLSNSVFLTFLIFFTGAVHVNFWSYLCCACTNEIRFYSIEFRYSRSFGSKKSMSLSIKKNYWLNAILRGTKKSKLFLEFSISLISLEPQLILETRELIWLFDLQVKIQQNYYNKKTILINSMSCQFES